jgi:hypothetical protein
MPGPELDPAELAEVQADVARDMRNGDGAKHFERELDELHSLQGSAHVDETPQVREELERFCRSFRDGLQDQVRSQGFRCLFVMPDGKGEGFHLQFQDKVGRRFEVEYSFDEGMLAAARSGEFMGRDMMREVIEKLLAARDRYFARMS